MAALACKTKGKHVDRPATAPQTEEWENGSIRWRQDVSDALSTTGVVLGAAGGWS